MARIIIGIIGFAAFAFPMFGGIFNIGTVTGLIFFGLLFLWGLFEKKLDPLIGAFISSKGGHIFAVVLAIVIICAAIAVSIETGCIMKAVLNKPSESNVTLILLGCKVNGTSPSLMLSERIDAAQKFLEENSEAKCVLSGGQGDDEEISEAQCMYNVLTANGISPERLFLEDKSTTTKENIEFSYDIIKGNGLSENVAVVTNEFHEYRAGLIAEETGLNCSSVPAKTALWLLPTYLVREWYAIIFEVVFR